MYAFIFKAGGLAQIVRMPSSQKTILQTVHAIGSQFHIGVKLPGLLRQL